MDIGDKIILRFHKTLNFILRQDESYPSIQVSCKLIGIDDSLYIFLVPENMGFKSIDFMINGCRNVNIDLQRYRNCSVAFVAKENFKYYV